MTKYIDRYYLNGELYGIKFAGGGWLPSEYQEVEYIESSWTQWIDTWFIPNQDTVHQIKVAFKNFSWDVTYWYNVWNDQTDVRFFNAWWDCFWDIPVDKRYQTYGVFSLDTVYELELGNWYVKNLVSWVDIFNWTPNPSFTGTNSITLNHNVSPAANSSNVWYYVKIYDWATLERDMVPCYRKSDNVIWMYDLVNGVFYTNSGTWSFTKWPNV